MGELKDLLDRLDERLALRGSPPDWAPEVYVDSNECRDLLDACVKMVKRIHRSQVTTVAAMPGTEGGFGLISLPREYVGKRVRLVLED